MLRIYATSSFWHRHWIHRRKKTLIFCEAFSLCSMISCDIKAIWSIFGKGWFAQKLCKITDLKGKFWDSATQASYVSIKIYFIIR